MKNLDTEEPSSECTLRQQVEMMSGTAGPAEVRSRRPCSVQKPKRPANPVPACTQNLLPRLAGDAYGSSRQANKLLLLNWVRSKCARQLVVDPVVFSAFAHGIKADSRYFCPHTAAQVYSHLVISVILQVSGAELKYEDKAWFSLLQHKALIAESLSQISRSSEDDLDEERVQACQKRLYDWVRAGAGTAEPRIMRALASFQSNSERHVEQQ